jgi:hypothetical protein
VEALIHIKSGTEIYETDYTNFEQSLNILEEMKNAYACYREIFHEKKGVFSSNFSGTVF